MRPTTSTFALLTILTFPFLTTSAPIPAPAFHLPQPNTLQPNHDKYNAETRPDRIKAKLPDNPNPPQIPPAADHSTSASISQPVSPQSPSSPENSPFDDPEPRRHHMTKTTWSLVAGTVLIALVICWNNGMPHRFMTPPNVGGNPDGSAHIFTWWERHFWGYEPDLMWPGPPGSWKEEWYIDKSWWKKYGKQERR